MKERCPSTFLGTPGCLVDRRWVRELVGIVMIVERELARGSRSSQGGIGVRMLESS